MRKIDRMVIHIEQEFLAIAKSKTASQLLKSTLPRIDPGERQLAPWADTFLVRPTDRWA
jgi:hypothetical protein